MSVRAAELLQQLASGVRPEGAGGARVAPGIDGRSFASLLSDVRAGKISSGRPVTVGPNVGVELRADQLERLARVADAGEAAGATRLGVAIDGRVVALDILTRTVEGEAAPGEVLTGIDGFVTAPKADEGDAGVEVAGEIASALGVEGVSWAGLDVVRNRSVAELLGSLVRDDEAGRGPGETGI